MAVIVLNMFVMMIKHDGQSEGVDYALNILYDVWFVFSDYFKSSGGGGGGGGGWGGGGVRRMFFLGPAI